MWTGWEKQYHSVLTALQFCMTYNQLWVTDDSSLYFFYHQECFFKCDSLPNTCSLWTLLFCCHLFFTPLELAWQSASLGLLGLSHYFPIPMSVQCPVAEWVMQLRGCIITPSTVNKVLGILMTKELTGSPNKITQRSKREDMTSAVRLMQRS